MPTFQSLCAIKVRPILFCGEKGDWICIFKPIFQQSFAIFSCKIQPPRLTNFIKLVNPVPGTDGVISQKFFTLAPFPTKSLTWAFTLREDE